jgi:tRNA pseudouridine55 synthase
MVKGTYIRTIADDLGKTLGFGAFANSLTRLRCGPFSLEKAVGLGRT